LLAPVAVGVDAEHLAQADEAAAGMALDRAQGNTARGRDLLMGLTVPEREFEHLALLGSQLLHRRLGARRLVAQVDAVALGARLDGRRVLEQVRRAIVATKVVSEPCAASNRPALRQTSRKMSWTASSASWGLRQNRRA
jgi:hypothetical protein